MLNMHKLLAEVGRSVFSGTGKNSSNHNIIIQLEIHKITRRKVSVVPLKYFKDFLI